ncbi:TonB-dependent receptor [Parapedobacter indicus]|nr:TonB-dependent receptor [Parapedobacter indicus]
MLRITILLVGISVMGANARSYSQTVHVSIHQRSIERLFTEIQRQTDYAVLYDDQLVSDQLITIKSKGGDLKDVLEEAFAQTDLTYKMDGKQILVMARPGERIRRQDTLITVQGTVRSDESPSQAIMGATVRELSTNRGVFTNDEGRFSIRVGRRSRLQISSVGFVTQEIDVNGRTQVDVVLTPGVSDLEEVVVVGYGTQKKINLTGAVSAVSGVDLENRPITNVGRGLQGLMPGVTVRNVNTAPGNQAPQIRIRGVGTWGDANPLVVVDGIPGGNLNILNPDDIESISVLKDAASSSIYGVRGANGVILVTTKQGKSGGKPAISLNSYFGMQTPTALPEFLGSPDYMMLQNEANINAGQNPTYTEEQIQVARDGSDPNYFANTDWIDEVYKPYAPQQSHAVNINGGGDNINYYASYGYLGEGGMVVGDNFKANRHNVRLRLNTTLIDRLKIDANLGYIDRDYSGSASGNSPLTAATSIRPLVPVRFTNGSWGYHGGQSNPVAWATDGGSNDFASQEVTANVSATLNIFKGLDLRGQYGLVKYSSRRTTFLKTIDYFSPDDNALIYQTNYPNQITLNNYTGAYQTFIGTANYAKTFAERHNLSALLGYSLEENIGKDFWASRQNLPTQDVPSLALGTENQLNNSSSSQNALMSFFGRVNYDFDSKYLLEGNFRYDGSSRFHPDVRWNWFGAVSAGWVFSAEEFFQPLTTFWDMGKFRVSYGTQGNDKVGSDFPYMAILSPVQVGSNNPIGDEGQVGFRQTFIPNQNLTWESAEKFNVGLDLAFLRNRLTVTGEYYVNTTKDILLNPPLPDVIGVGSGYPAQNSGEVQNKGWELIVGWQDKVGDFEYRVNANLSDVRNKVTKLENFATNLGDRVRLEGYPLDAFYGFIAERIAQYDDFDLVDGDYVAKFPFQSGDVVGPGDLIYRPANPDDEAITVQKDRHILGSDIPRYTYGFRGDLAWKGIDFSFFIQGVGKADGFLTGSARHPFINNSAMPQKIHLDRWTPDNPDASYPRFVYMRTHNTRLSSYWIEDASYLRLKNIQLGYSLPSRWLEGSRLGKVRVYASADNLFTMTDFFYGYDPEVPAGNSGGYYPMVKTFVFGLNVNLQ